MAALFGAGLLAGVPLAAQAAATTLQLAPDTAHITSAVDNGKLVALKGSALSSSLARYDAGALAAGQPIHSVTLLLARSPDKQQRFEAYLNQLSNPSSPYYHQWLTAKQVGAMFGPAPDDIAKVTSWLASQGLSIDAVAASGVAIRFSGSASSIGRAFHTQLHRYTVNGEQHFANNSALQIPAALAGVVSGVASLHNFFPVPQHTESGLVHKDKATGKWQSVAKSNPQFTVPGGTLDPDTAYDLAPADFNKIYNVQPLWSAATPIRGAGQSVAVLERTSVQSADVSAFRKAFLPPDAKGTVSYVNPVVSSTDTSCPNPASNGDEGEAALDAEWIGAAAPDANIVFAACDDSQSATFGPFTAAINLLEAATLPPAVFSLSYGECEPAGFVDGMANQAASIWQLAAAEGVTVYVSSGDAGSVGCDQNEAAAYQGLAVNSLASTPYNVAVGGTDFDDLNNTSRYWTAGNLPQSQSALSYIPEQTWNDSCASSKLFTLFNYPDGVTACNDLRPTGAGTRFLSTAGGSGGPSTNWLKPSWQAGIYGTTNYTSRTLPDVSLFSANGLNGHALVFCMSDSSEGGHACDYSNPDDVFYNSAGGTSFAAPAMAGVQALINQAANERHGNVLPAFYDLGIKEYGTIGYPQAGVSNCNSSAGPGIGSNCIFNDVTVGDIDEPCYAGTSDCYSGKQLNYGVASEGGSVALVPAYLTNAGYDMATGLGSINASNLVNALVKYDQPFQRGYLAPTDFLSPDRQNGDGYSDIALVDPVAGKLQALEMDGSVITQSYTKPIGQGLTLGAIGRFFRSSGGLFGSNSNIDGLAWSNPDGQLYVWLAAANLGITDAAPPTLSAKAPAGWKLVGAGDFDGSGQDELLWRNDAAGQLQWWKLDFHVLFVLGRAQYHFSYTASPTLSAGTGYVPTVADVDGDGYADIVWTNPHNNATVVWINNHNGDFVRQNIINHPTGYSLYGAGDINGDGKTDLIWIDPTDGKVAWWLMNGFTVAGQQSVASPKGYNLAAVADYDGDGLADLLWTDPAGEATEWQGSGSGFQSFRVIDQVGNPLVIPAGMTVQASRLQGSGVGIGASASSAAVMASN